MQTFTGTVVKGAAKGRTLGYPTANLDTKDHNLDTGVYKGNATIDSKTYDAAICVNWEKVIEVHLLDFDGDIYGKTLTLEDVTFHRKMVIIKDETKLREVIAKDVQTIRCSN